MRLDTFSENNPSVFLAPGGPRSSGDLDEWDDLRSITRVKSMASINQDLLEEVPRKLTISDADGLLPMSDLLNSQVRRMTTAGDPGSPVCIGVRPVKKNSLYSKIDLRNRRISYTCSPHVARALKIEIIESSPMNRDHDVAPKKFAKFPGMTTPKNSEKFPRLNTAEESSKFTDSGKNTFDYSRSGSNQKSSNPSPWNNLQGTNQKSSNPYPWNNLQGENTVIATPVAWPASGLGQTLLTGKTLLADVSSEGSESDLFESRMTEKTDQSIENDWSALQEV